MNLLSEHRDSAYKSLELATIVYDAPINFDLKDALFGDYDIAEAKRPSWSTNSEPSRWK